MWEKLANSIHLVTASPFHVRTQKNNLHPTMFKKHMFYSLFLLYLMWCVKEQAQRPPLCKAGSLLSNYTLKQFK